MNQFLYLIPALTVLIGAMVLMFMSMYKRFLVKDFIIVSSVFLIVAFGFTASHVEQVLPVLLDAIDHKNEY